MECECWLHISPLLAILALLSCTAVAHPTGGDIVFQYSAESDTCTTPNELEGACMALRMCPVLLKLLQDPSPTNIHFLQRSGCGFAGAEPLVCCPQQAEEPTEAPPAADNTVEVEAVPAVMTTAGIPAMEPSPSPEAPSGDPDSNDVFPENCGLSGLSSRIRGGQLTEPGLYPWMAALAYKTESEKGYAFLCGGSLLNSKFVLTAAHCLVDKEMKLRELTFVRLGDSDLWSKDDGVEEVDYQVENSIPHPDYRNKPAIVNDIALIKLDKEALYTSFIGPVCLPVGQRSALPTPGTELVIAGWGRSGSESSGLSPVLLSARIPLVNLSRCREQYTSLNIEIQATQVCASAPGKDSCGGDSGGPLMVSHMDSVGAQRMVAVGVLSFGSISCDGVLPGVYTSTVDYVPWMAETMRLDSASSSPPASQSLHHLK